MSVKNEVIVAETTEADNPELLAEAAPTVISAIENVLPQVEAKKPEKNRTRGYRITIGQVVSWFAVCVRCSFFLASYKLTHGAEELQRAVETSDDGWLTLKWDHSMCHLIRKSFGSNVDIDCYHFDGSCPTCRRQFFYRYAEDDETATRLRIEIKPRIGR